MYDGKWRQSTRDFYDDDFDEDFFKDVDDSIMEGGEQEGEGQPDTLGLDVNGKAGMKRDKKGKKISDPNDDFSLVD